MDRISKIRYAEAQSHMEVYRKHDLFSEGSWLSKPVKTVMDLLDQFDGYKELRILDLGSGVGRNSIPVAKYFEKIPCQIDCVDILEMAIRKLNFNAERYGVPDAIHVIVESIEDYKISGNSYDLILAISALEHMDSKESFVHKLMEIRRGLRDGGIGCLIINTSVREHSKTTAEERDPQFEVNIPTQELQSILEKIFCGWTTLKNTVTHQKYDIPRVSEIVELEADVVTYVVRQTAGIK